MAVSFDPEKYRIKENSKVNLKKLSTLEEVDKSDAKKLIAENIEKLVPLQKALFAEAKQSIIFVFQAMDAAGKDSTIQKVFTGMNPQGFQGSNFRKPSKNEMAHDFLWRVHSKVPRRGNIGAFNRSHYEEVLVTKVHTDFILYQTLPGINSKEDINETFWDERYKTIADFESHLHKNGSKVVKFFLNVSKAEQKRRLLSRMEVPEKNWKVNLQDTKERAHWKEYQEAYTTAIEKTSTEDSPWYIIPADHKWTMRGIVSTIILEELKKLNPQFPGFDEEARKEMEEARSILMSE